MLLKTRQRTPFEPTSQGDQKTFHRICIKSFQFQLVQYFFSGYQVIPFYRQEFSSKKSFVTQTLFITTKYTCGWPSLGIALANSCVGLKAPQRLKLNFANFNCSMKYGKADSLKFPIICRDIKRPASCSFSLS